MWYFLFLFCGSVGTYGVLMTSRSHWPLMSSSCGCSFTNSPSNSSFRATSFSRLKITRGTCQSNHESPWLKSSGSVLEQTDIGRLVSYEFWGFKADSIYKIEFIIGVKKRAARPVHLEAVVTNNATEGDDCVCNSQEMECRLHVAAALLQYKINRGLCLILCSR